MEEGQYISDDTAHIGEAGSVWELEQLIYELRDRITPRSDVDEIVQMLYENGVILDSGFCRRKRPSPPTPKSV